MKYKKKKGENNVSYQALKSLQKIAKIAKAFLIQKAIRQSKKGQQEGDSLLVTNALEIITTLKNTRHIIAAECAHKIFLGCEKESVLRDVTQKNGVELILNQKKLVNTISEWRKKADSVTSHRTTSTSKAKPQSIQGRNKAIFLESLEDSALSKKVVGHSKQNSARSSLVALRFKTTANEKRSHYMPQPKPLHESDAELQVESKYSKTPVENRSTGKATVRFPDSACYESAESLQRNDLRMPVDNEKQHRTRVNQQHRSNVQHIASTTSSDLNTAVVSGKDWRETGVHPSWAAKQLNRTKLTSSQFLGKKITFDATTDN